MIEADLERMLRRKDILSAPLFAAGDIMLETAFITMRDGTRLATDLYLPPKLPAPVIAIRTPYGRDADQLAANALAYSRRGYVVAVQDLRGTGGSEPDKDQFYMFEPEDGWDFVEWIGNQPWYGGFIGSIGGSYVGQVQWPMAMHPKMTTIVPEVSGLGVGVDTVHRHMVMNALARTIGKGEDKDVPAAGLAYLDMEMLMLDETLSTGLFNEPLVSPKLAALAERFPAIGELPTVEAQSWLWAHYCSLTCAERAEFVRLVTRSPQVTILDVEVLPEIFGRGISMDRHTLPSVDPGRQVADLHAVPLLRTGWYDWFLNDALATWSLLREHASEPLRSKARLIVTPAAHNLPGYKEGMGEHPELQHNYGGLVDVSLAWYQAVRDDTVDSWPRVVYYLMGANEWRSAADWPLPSVHYTDFYLGADGTLDTSGPSQAEGSDCYAYDPMDPTPTVGGSIVSHVYPAGSADVSEVQSRSDVLTYTTPPLETDVDVVGPLKLVLYASSSSVDTDFAARLSDVFPDGRAIQLQNNVLRARHRDLARGPELLVPGEVYRLEIDLWATANRFKAGHRIRLDLSSADFPRYDRNSNLGGARGEPVVATQTIYRDAQRPTHLVLPVLPKR